MPVNQSIAIVTHSIVTAAIIAALANQNQKFQKLDGPNNYGSQSTRHIFLRMVIYIVSINSHISIFGHFSRYIMGRSEWYI